MAPGVAKTFVKELYKVMCIRYPECSGPKKYGNMSNEDIKEHLKQYIKEHRLILNNLDYVRELIETKYSKGISGGEVTRLFDAAMRFTEDATHQAMEAVIHNLNSMHCLPYYQKLWVLDTLKNEFNAMQIGDLTNNFEQNRYKVISLNTKTGMAELKYVKAAKNMGNNRELYKTRNNQGANVVTTGNHRLMTMSGSDITAKIPSEAINTISPRGIKLPCVNNDISLEKYGIVRRDSPYSASHITVTEQFAELMGYYMADGCILGNTGTMCLTTCGKVSFEDLRGLVREVFDSELKESTTYFNHSKEGLTEKDFRVGVGMRVARMIADKFGRVGKEKKIPIEILFATDNIKEAFLKAYFRCDGSHTKKYGEIATINKELQAQVVFMLYSLKVSPHLSTRVHTNGFDKNKDRVAMHGITFSNEDAARIGIKERLTAFSIPKYDLTMVPYNNAVKCDRASGNIRYSELEDMVHSQGIKEFAHLENIFINKIESIEKLNDTNIDVFDISVEDNENFMTYEGIYVHNSRAGAQVL